MADAKKVLFLTISDRKGASSRYRVYDYLPYLEKAGIMPVVLPPEKRKGSGISGLLERKREEDGIIGAATDADAVFIQKRLYPVSFIKRLGSVGRPVVFDFDDSIFTSPSGDWSFLTRKKVDARLRAVIRASRLVITGNAFLADYAAGAGAIRVEVLPTAIDISKYRVKEHEERAPVLGWIGSSVNYRYLDMLSGVLPRLAGKIEGLKLLVVSDRDYRMHGVEVENRRWSEETEASDLLDMDIGLMPLADDEWTRGKCALKALQYMACGIPAVCSPVGANNEVVEDGVDGYLPQGDGAWFERLAGLCLSPELRAELGGAGRKKVSEHYSTAKTAARLAELLGSL